MTGALREKVARATHPVAFELLDAYKSIGGLGWKDLDRDCETFRKEADAAIRAVLTHYAEAGPTDEMQISGVEAMAKALRPFEKKLRAEGMSGEAAIVAIISSSLITGPVFKAMMRAALKARGE